MNKEESALDVIFEIREQLNQQQRQIAMLQASLNTIGAKVNNTLYADFTSPKAIASDVPLVQEPAIAEEPVSKPELEPAEELPAPVVPKQVRNVRVFGHFDDEVGKALSGVVVRISDTNNNVVKQTKSNRAGLWMSFLPPGNYIAEFIMDGMQSEAREFTLLEGKKELEIG